MPTNLKPVILVANGDIQDTNWLKNEIGRGAEAIVGVDGGTNYLLNIDALPDIVIGDLDSMSADHIKQLEDNWVNIFRYSHEKDETDLEIALLYAADQPNWIEKPFHIYGAQGGRLDHEIANLMLLTHPKLKNLNIRLLAPNQTTFLIQEGKSAAIHGRSGDTVSLIPLKGDAPIEKTENLKWPLTGSTLKFGPARGVSNIMTASNSMVTVKSGLVLCIHTDSQWDR